MTDSLLHQRFSRRNLMRGGLLLDSAASQLL